MADVLPARLERRPTRFSLPDVAEKFPSPSLVATAASSPQPASQGLATPVVHYCTGQGPPHGCCSLALGTPLPPPLPRSRPLSESLPAERCLLQIPTVMTESHFFGSCAPRRRVLASVVMAHKTEKTTEKERQGRASGQWPSWPRSLGGGSVGGMNGVGGGGWLALPADPQKGGGSTGIYKGQSWTSCSPTPPREVLQKSLHESLQSNDNEYLLPPSWVATKTHFVTG